MKNTQQKRTIWVLPSWRYYGLLFFILALTGAYLYAVTTAFLAYRNAQQFTSTLALAAELSVPLQDADVLPGIQAALQQAPNQAEYAHQFGQYLLQQAITRQAQENAPASSKLFETAEYWLVRAIRLDPADPWYPYELGNLSYYRNDCLTMSQRLHHQSQFVCPTTRYYLAALRNAPKNLFLRQEILRWYQSVDPPAARQLLHDWRASDTTRSVESPSVAKNFAKFLYELQWDYESDRELQPESSCPSDALTPPAAPRLELHHDDGSAEWKTSLTTDASRVKKVFCLPADRSGYRTATLKIFLHRTGQDRLQVKIWLDDHLLELPRQSFPAIPRWYEIPVDLALFNGKTIVTVYIRCQSASVTSSALHVWGDRDTPTALSEFNFQQIRDLSSDPRTQTGEYLIRLALQ